MFWAALILAVATIWLSIRRRPAAVVFIEAIIIWTVAYFLLVGVSSAPYAGPGVLQRMVLIGAVCTASLVFVRWTLKQAESDPE